MQVGDLVRSTIRDDQTSGVITRLRRNSMNSSDKYATFYVYWSSLGHVTWEDYSSLEAVNESR